MKDSNIVDIETATGETTAHSEVALETETIDPNVIDFDFSKIKDEFGVSGSENFQSINPVNKLSHRVEIDLNKLDREGFITPKFSNTLLSSTFRMVKRPLLNNIAGKNASQVENANLIMLTSSSPGEGKTFSAINLAISLAMEKDKHVLLIDSDVNKPSHHKIFGIDNRAGLTDYLLGEVEDMGEVLWKTNIASLSVMSSGRLYEYSTELLASEAMDKFIHEISRRYKDRIVIFDSPPLLHTTESSVLATHMGQVVLVVEAEATLNYMVKKSLDLLSNEIVLILLNKQREKNSMDQYGYYGYGHKH
jgi:receptor protein-tyrosine kinase